MVTGVITPSQLQTRSPSGLQTVPPNGPFDIQRTMALCQDQPFCPSCIRAGLPAVRGVTGHQQEMENYFSSSNTLSTTGSNTTGPLSLSSDVNDFEPLNNHRARPGSDD